VDGLDLGVYTFRIAVNDSSGNSAYHDVQVTVVDTTVPNLLTPIPIDFQYEFGSTGNIITWYWNESHPDMYNITRLDGPYVNISATVYSNGTAINFNVDGLAVGSYTYRIGVNDTSGNSAYHDVQVTVVDTTAPIRLIEPPDMNYEFGTSNHIITWRWTDPHPHKYNITRLDGPYTNKTGNFVNDSDISLNVDGLAVGVYTFRIAVNDTYGNSAYDDVQVTVTVGLPILESSPLDIQYEFGSTGNFINWNWTDPDPDKYNITREDTGDFVYDSVTWDNASIIQFNVDGLAVGAYNYTVWVNDTFGNANFDTVLVTVVDTTPPNILSPIPSNIQYEYGSSGHIISWYWNESHPDMYNISRLDGPYINVTGTPYTNGTVINFDVDGLDLGVYTFRIAVNDSYGNSAYHDVQVIVVDTTVPNLLTPIPTDFQYEFGSTGNIITWYWNESHPDKYNITRLDGPYVNVSATSYTNGTAINFNADGLDVGVYTFRIAINDTTGNSVYHDVQVTVVDTTLPNILTPIPSNIQYEFGSTGNTIIWYWNESHPDKYNITRLDGPYVNQTGTSFTNGSAINFNVDGLDLGVYTFRIAVNDTTGNSAYHDVQVTVVDTTPPNIPLPPSDIIYQIGSQGNQIIWIWNESHPDKYNITWIEGATLNQSGSYQNYTGIVFNVDNLSVGVYTFRIGVNDTSGNSFYDNVTVEVAIDLVYPFINVTNPLFNRTTKVGNIYQIEGFVNGTGSPISAVTINDSRFILNTDPSTSLWGVYSFINNSYLADGIITLKISVNDSGGLTSNITIIFRVLQISNGTSQQLFANRENIVYCTIIPNNIVCELIIFVSVDTNITISFYPNNPTGQYLENSVGFFQFTLENNSALINVTLKLFYNESSLGNIAEGDLSIYYFNAGNWVRLEATLNTTGNYLEYFSTSLSYYSIAAKTQELSPFLIFPTKSDEFLGLMILLGIVVAAVVIAVAVQRSKKKKPKRKTKESERRSKPLSFPVKEEQKPSTTAVSEKGKEKVLEMIKESKKEETETVKKEIKEVPKKISEESTKTAKKEAEKSEQKGKPEVKKKETKYEEKIQKKSENIEEIPQKSVGKPVEEPDGKLVEKPIEKSKEVAPFKITKIDIEESLRRKKVIAELKELTSKDKPKSIIKPTPVKPKTTKPKKIKKSKKRVKKNKKKTKKVKKSKKKKKQSKKSKNKAIKKSENKKS